MRSLPLWAALVFTGCGNQLYVIVKLTEAPGLPPVVQLALTSGDGVSQATSTYPTVPAGPIAFPKSYVVAVPKGASEVSVQVSALDAPGNVVAKGAAEAALTGVTATLAVTLSAPCASSVDCGSSAVCSGAQVCGDGGFCVSGSGNLAADFTTCAADGGLCYGGQCQFLTQCATSYDCGDGVCSGNATCNDGGYCIPGGTGQLAPDFTPCNSDGGACYAGQCIQPHCGDGIADEPGKQCDLGAQNSNAGSCTLACQLAFCGDGFANQDPLADGGVVVEECDWGSGADGGACTGPDGGCNSDTLPDHCRTDCRLWRCGDGVVDTGERCDLGPAWPDGGGGNGTGSGCNATCTLLEQVSTFAGTTQGTYGYVDGAASQARFKFPSGITEVGRTLYVADSFNDLVRAIDLGTGTVSTLAGQPGNETTLDGTGGDAGFYSPSWIRPYQGGLAVAESTAVRLVTLGGAVTTLTGSPNGVAGQQNGTLAQAQFQSLKGIEADGPILFVSDSVYGIRDLDVPADAVTTLGDGGILSAYSSAGLLVLDGGLYFADSRDSDVQLMDLATGRSTVIAGISGTSGFADGPEGTATFRLPTGLCSDGFSIYVTDMGNSALRQLDPVTGAVTTVAGNGSNLSSQVQDGVGRNATFGGPSDCVYDPVSGDLFVVDEMSCSVRRIH